MSDPMLIRESRAQDFMSTHSGLRIGSSAKTRLIALLTEAARQVVLAAKEKALEDEVNTLMERHITAGFDQWLSDSAPSLNSPAVMFQAIESISNEGLVELANLIKTDLLELEEEDDS